MVCRCPKTSCVVVAKPNEIEIEIDVIRIQTIQIDFRVVFRLMTEFLRTSGCPIVVEYRNGGVGGELELPEAWRVNLEDPLLARLKDWLAPENVRVVY